jgi:5,5'-dehydrodivanillate O-demethylase
MQFTPNDTGAAEPQPDAVPFEHVSDFRNESGEYHLDTFGSQDAMAWETQGPVTDRSREHLGAADRGIALYRRLLQEQIDKVAAGEEPEGIIRDAAVNERIEIEVSTGQRRVAKELSGA